MSEPQCLLDSDTISFAMRREPRVLEMARVYLDAHHRYTISVISRYEVLGGLMHRGASSRRLLFEWFLQSSEVLPLSEPVAVRAASVYAQLRRAGQPIDDLDILIAATALHHGLVLVTNNTRHFERIKGLRLQNWMNKP